MNHLQTHLYRLTAHNIKTIRAATLTMIIIPILIAGCASSSSKTQADANSQQVKETKIGLASYYSRGFHGEETASGKIFNNNELVAAHPSFPLGTTVRVTNLENNKQVEVKVIDRGPSDDNQREGVIIDLSRTAAEKLGMVKDGRVNVKVEVLEWGTDQRQ